MRLEQIDRWLLILMALSNIKCNAEKNEKQKDAFEEYRVDCKYSFVSVLLR